MGKKSKYVWVKKFRKKVSMCWVEKMSEKRSKY